MSEWKKYKLGEVYEFSSGLSKSSDQFGFGYDFLTFKDVFNNFFMPKQLTALVNSTEKERQTCSIKRGDVFLTRTSETDDELGMSSVALRDYPNATFNGFTKRLRPKGNIEIYPEFVAYYFRSPKFRANITGMSSITTRASLNNSMLAQLPLLLPSINEQVEIASILKSIDDKIDLLNRENATLEAMAETLFRQWFIEEAKEDWEEGKLGDLIEVKYGKDHKKLKDGNIPVFGSGGIMRYADTALYDKESVLIPRKGSLNNVMYINEPFWTVDTMFYTEMRRPNIAKFIYHFMKGQNLANMNVGSAVPSMTTDVLNNIPIDIPPQNVFDKYENSVGVLYYKKEYNNKQIQTLIHTRDGLLPRLMGGEMKI